MTFTADRIAVSTLAHELGLALHGGAAQDQGFLAPRYRSRFRTASLFTETLCSRDSSRGPPTPAPDLTCC